MIGEPGNRWNEVDTVRKIDERKESNGTRGAGISVVEGNGGVDMLEGIVDNVDLGCRPVIRERR